MCKFYPLKVGRVPRQCRKEVHHSGLLWLENRLIYLNTENKSRGGEGGGDLFMEGNLRHKIG